MRELFSLWRKEREDPEPFYSRLAERAASDLDRFHGPLAGQRVIDLGCGPGWYTRALRARGADVLPIDSSFAELELGGNPPQGAIIGDAMDLALPDASVDGVFASNMLEHTPEPQRVITEIERVLRPGGWGYVSWTNWYSPWGGHDMTPYHFLGPRLGLWAFQRRNPRHAKNVVGVSLWPVHIGPMLRFVRSRAGLELERAEPRYWPWAQPIVRVPLLREVATWNCVLRLRRLPD